MVEYTRIKKLVVTRLDEISSLSALKQQDLPYLHEEADVIIIKKAYSLLKKEGGKQLSLILITPTFLLIL